jgi:hypothetical protein
VKKSGAKQQSHSQLQSKGTRDPSIELKLKEYAQYNLVSALHTLFKLHPHLPSLQRVINDEFDDHYHDLQYDGGTETSVLHDIPPNKTPWESCDSATRATIVFMRKQIEKGGITFPGTDKEMYERWIADESCRHVFVAEMKEEVGAKLTSEERQLLSDIADR